VLNPSCASGPLQNVFQQPAKPRSAGTAATEQGRAQATIEQLGWYWRGIAENDVHQGRGGGGPAQDDVTPVCA
jgi:hypothetical protein